MAKEKVLVIDADSAVYALGFMAERKEHMAVHKGKIVKMCNLDATDEEREQGACKYKTDLNKWAKTQTDYPIDEIEYDYTVKAEDVHVCLAGVRNYIEDLHRTSGCDRYIVLLTKGGKDFRTMLATIRRYKGNRLGMDKPKHYDSIRRYMRRKHSALTYAKWEADDAACMAMHNGNAKDGSVYILAAIDKDLNQVMGQRYNPNHKEEGIYPIDEWDAWFSFYVQMLEGDTSDNIKGLSGTKAKPGIGHKKAEKMLLDCEDATEMCQVVLDAYKAKYGEEPFEHTPWWWEDQWKDDDLAKLYRKKGHPHYGKAKTLTRTYVDMFRENADLLYMLRTPRDQYVPHVAVEGWTQYESGTVKEFLGD